MNQINSKEGSIAFVIPFSFIIEENDKDNYCLSIFHEIKKSNNAPKDASNIYHEQKQKLLSHLREKSNLFSNASECYSGGITGINFNNIVRNCSYIESIDSDSLSQEYEGRNLCHCFSISRKFHDDASQNIQRVEFFLGSYPVNFSLPKTESNVKKSFNFYIDSLLLLNGEEGCECGYLVFVISLHSIQDELFNHLNSDFLDNIIFIKHLFYKNRLKCLINDEVISIQNWTDRYLKQLLSALEVSDYGAALNSYIENDEKSKKNGAAFRYSIIELNNVKDVESEKLVSIANVDVFLNKYRNQLYGLMVSDEGWRFISDDELICKFNNNHWASRSFTCSFFLGHNAIIVNQYDSEECKDYCNASNKWYGSYINNPNLIFYQKYCWLRPCVPGVASLTFFAFLKAIHKEMMLGKAMELSDSLDVTDEEKYRRLAHVLQHYSMELDEIKNVEDCIYYQFGIPLELNEIQNRYKREANNVQNKKVVNLTRVTAWISLSALVVATLALAIDKEKTVLIAYKHITTCILVLAITAAFLSYISTAFNMRWFIKRCKRLR